MKLPNYDEIVRNKIAYYGETLAAFEFAAEEYANQKVKYDRLFGDSQDLLEKFIQHVRAMEGYDFIDDIHCNSDSIHFTPNEINILNSLKTDI